MPGLEGIQATVNLRIELVRDLLTNVAIDGFDPIPRRTLAMLFLQLVGDCLLYTSPSPRDATLTRMPSSA